MEWILALCFYSDRAKYSREAFSAVIYLNIQGFLNGVYPTLLLFSFFAAGHAEGGEANSDA